MAIDSIAEWMASAIKTMAPSLRGSVAMVEASKTAPIEELEADGTRATRQFQVQIGAVQDLGDFVGPCYELQHDVRVVVRYMLDTRSRSEWDEIQKMAGTDAALIIHTLMRPPLGTPWTDAQVWNVSFQGHETLHRNETQQGVWEQAITFRILYALGYATQATEFVSLYATYADLSATDGALSWGSSGRAEVRRLLAGDMYYWTGSEWALYYEPGDVPALADLTAIEAATLAGEQVAYSTADTRLARVDTAVARLLYDEGDVNTYASVAAMEASTLYGDEIGVSGGSIYQMSGADAVLQTRHGSIESYTDLPTLEADTPATVGDVRGLSVTDAVGTYRADYKLIDGPLGWNPIERLGLEAAQFVGGNDLLAYWDLNETSGTTAADTATGIYPGTIIGGVTLGTLSPVTGDRYGLTFDGVNGRVDMGDVLDVGLGSFSVAVWFRQVSGAAGFGELVSKFLTVPYWHLNISNAGAPRWSVRDSVGSDVTAVGPVAPVDSLSHIAAVLDRASAKITMYVNGVAGTSVSIAVLGTLDTANKLVVGAYAAGANPFKGDCFSVAMFGKALTADEVSHLYAAGAP